MPECDVFIRSFHDRLKYSHDAVAVHGDEWKAKYCDVLKLSSRYCAERHYWSDWLEERLSRTRLASSTPRWTASLWALVCSTQAPGISGRRTGPEKPFFVCEDASGGNIFQFFGKEENQGLFWSTFLQVAQGLKVLHDHHIVHDGLKSGNILLAKNNTPKISDFDCSHIRTMSASFSRETENAKEEAVRWKPREKLVEGDNLIPQFKSDVYSLGMCIIEAKTQLPPFGMDVISDDEVMEKVIRGESYQRPEEVSDREWDVISRLIAPDINQRPSVVEAIELIRRLAQPTKPTTRWLSEEHTSLSGASLGKIISTGLLLGVVHVLTGPDHLSALAAMTTGSSWRAFTLGIRWGCGHSIGLIFMALIFFAAGQTVDLDAVGGYLNYVVGFFMIALGAWTAVHVRKRYQTQLKEGVQSLVSGEGERVDSNRASRSSTGATPTNLVELVPLSQRRVSSATSPAAAGASPQISMSPANEHALEEASASPSSSFHLVVKEDSNSSQVAGIGQVKPSKLHPTNWNCCRNASFENPATQKIMALLVGIIHGFAGPGGILGVLPAVVLNDWVKSVAYLGSFCVASIFIMGVFAALYGEVTGRIGGNSLVMEFRIGVFSAFFSFIVGVAWIGLQATGQMSAVFGDIFSAVCKYLTGLCLVFLGVWTLYDAHQDYTETNVPPSPTHFASPSNSRWSQVQCQDASYVLLQSPNDPSVKIQLSTASAASIGAGIVHGAAGPGCLLAVLPTLAMQKDTLRALLYLGCFCGSSIVSMGSFAALYGELTQRGGRVRSPSAAFYVAVASSVLSIGVGTAWVVLQATGVLNRVFGD
ncbi:Protein kinase-like domain [Phytophthora cactorum]|nr:Protein kinase-like domain [Phytophthora cactorum]